MSNSGLVSWEAFGAGYPIVLIHGFGEDATIWNHQLASLQTKYRVVVPHLRGSGLSSAAAPPSSIEQMAEDVKKMLDEENISKCIMIGHSMGGYVALAFAEKYMQLLDGFGLIHSTAFADSEEKKEARKKSIEFIQQNTAAAFISATIPNLFGEQFRQQHPAQVEELIQKGEHFTKEALIAYYECMIARPDRTEVLKSSPVPVLFFIGSEDKAVNPADALKQTALPKICAVEVMEHIAHMGMWEATEQLNKYLHEFVTYSLSVKVSTVESFV